LSSDLTNRTTFLLTTFMVRLTIPLATSTKPSNEMLIDMGKQVMKYYKDAGITICHEVPQVLIQAFLVFQKNPVLDVHWAFVRGASARLQIHTLS